METGLWDCDCIWRCRSVNQGCRYSNGGTEARTQEMVVCVCMCLLQREQWFIQSQLRETAEHTVRWKIHTEHKTLWEHPSSSEKTMWHKLYCKFSESWSLNVLFNKDWYVCVKTYSRDIKTHWMVCVCLSLQPNFHSWKKQTAYLIQNL